VSLDTYDNLKVEIEEHLDRDDLNDRIDTFIDIAEAAHRDDVRFREILVRLPITLADGDRTEDLPADFAQIKYLRFENPWAGYQGKKYLPKLVQVTEDQLTDLAMAGTGHPKYFSIEERIEFEVEADRDYTGELLYYKQMTPLGSTNASNELLVRAPDLYLYRALLASAPFLMNDERLETWGRLYDRALGRVNESERTNRRAGPQVARVKGV
jgi:hypothetical protein